MHNLCETIRALGLEVEGIVKVGSREWQRGARVQIGVVEGVQVQTATTETTPQDAPASRVTGVRVDGSVLPCDSVIVALGPWSSAAAEWFPQSVPRGSIRRVRTKSERGPGTVRSGALPSARRLGG